MKFAPLTLAFLALTSISSAQTSTYDLTGQGCNAGGPKACTFHFSDGSYWSTGSPTGYIFTPPGAIEPSADSCSSPAAGNWTQDVANPVPFNTPVNFTFGCTTTARVQMSAAFRAQAYQIDYVCGKGGTRICHATRWVVNSGVLMIGPASTAFEQHGWGILPVKL